MYKHTRIFTAHVYLLHIQKMKVDVYIYSTYRKCIFTPKTKSKSENSIARAYMYSTYTKCAKITYTSKITFFGLFARALNPKKNQNKIRKPKSLLTKNVQERGWRTFRKLKFVFATHCNTVHILHHTAPYCTILHHTATHCNILQYTAPLLHTQTKVIEISHNETIHCITLHHAATHRNTLLFFDMQIQSTLHRNAPHCNTLLSFDIHTHK